MDIKLDLDQIKELVSESIYASLDEQKKETLIKGALIHLLTPTGNSVYSPKTSPLEDAFNRAIFICAREISTDLLSKNEETKQKITGLLMEALTKITETNREKTIDRLANAITDGLAYRDQ